MSMKPICKSCGSAFSPKRRQIGYTTCLPCGEKVAKKHRHTIVPMHKSNYMVVTDLNLLKGINNKGGNHNGL